MADYILSCCSTADLSKDHLQARNIHYICFHYELNGTSYSDDLGQTIKFSDFYAMMEADAEVRTSQVNVSEYTAYFEPFLKQGKDVLHLCLSSGLSGSYNSAKIAAEMLSEQYPQQKLIVIDSLAASSGYGLLMDKLADLRDEGMSFDELAQWAESNKLRLQHWFFSTTLKYYIKGGRISKTAGFFGSMLGICPLLHVDAAGRLCPVEKVRSKKKVQEAIVQKMENLADDRSAYSGKCYMCQSACYEDAKVVADAVESRFPQVNGSVLINDIGTVIGSHTGPGTVALFFWGDSRAENG